MTHLPGLGEPGTGVFKEDFVEKVGLGLGVEGGGFTQACPEGGNASGRGSTERGNRAARRSESNTTGVMLRG